MSILDTQRTPPPPRLAQRTAVDWRELLLAQLAVQVNDTALYEAFYDGRHPLQFATSKYREAFGNQFGAFADNWCQIVVDSAVERLRVVGFQIDGQPSEEAWALWQASSLDVQSVIAHTEAGKCGRAYLLVDPSTEPPRITVEHCAQVIVAHDPGDRRKRLAAVKKWLGDDGIQYLTLYLPDVVLRWESDGPAVPGVAATDWVPRTDSEAEVRNPLGVVPVIPLDNKPGLLGRPHSDLESAVPLQNAVNKLCADMIVTSEYAAFPQRVVTGIEVPRDPETGAPLHTADELKSAQSRLWAFRPADAQVTSLPAADLSNFVTAIEMFIQHLAAQTRTPPHYLLAKLVNTSGDALSVAEAGLVSKCRAKTLYFSDAWEEAIALALRGAGTEVDLASCEALWANPERVALGQLVDAAVKKQTLGVPLPVIWSELGYTPEQVAEMEAIEEEAPPPPPAPVPPAPPQQAPPPAAPPSTQEGT